MTIKVSNRFSDWRRTPRGKSIPIGKFEEGDKIVSLSTLKKLPGIVEGIVYTVDDVREVTYTYPYSYIPKIRVKTIVKGLDVYIPVHHFKRATAADCKRSSQRLRALLTELNKTCDTLEQDIYQELFKSEQAKEELKRRRALCYEAIGSDKPK